MLRQFASFSDAIAFVLKYVKAAHNRKESNGFYLGYCKPLQNIGMRY